MKLKKKQAWPSKRTLNLVINELPPHYYRNVLSVAVIVFALIGAFCKFAVIDRLASVDKEQDITDALRIEYEAQASLNVDFESVRAEYDRYYANNVARGTVTDIAEVLRVIDEQLMRSAEVTSLSLSNNTLSVVLSGIDLDSATRVLTELYENEPFVKNVELYTATNPDSGDPSLAMTVVFDPKGGAE